MDDVKEKPQGTSVLEGIFGTASAMKIGSLVRISTI
jgi:hypothetical protein